MIPVELHADVDRHHVTFVQYALLRRDAVDDLIVDRAADARREIVQAFERRDRSRMAADEIFSDGIELRRGHAGLHGLLHQLHSVGENTAPFGHDLDLTL